MNQWLTTYGHDMLACTLEHLGLAFAALTCATTLGIPLGILCTRNKRLGALILTAANIVQTVPSLALFGFLIPLPFGGIGARTAVIALTLYALLPIMRSTCDGIRNVTPSIIDAARGMGLTHGQILRLVELPLAAPIIVSGLRVAAVLSVGIATIAAAVGAGGLGTLIFRGVAMVNHELILAGAVPAALLALFIDALLGLLAYRLTYEHSR